MTSRMIAAAALLLCLGCASHTAPADVLTPDELASRLAQARAAKSGGEVLCRLDKTDLHYAGPTETPLLECLERHPGAERLIITSFGGSVREAIPAARRVMEMDLDVVVAGICGSSCGNYVVPAAASLTVHPNSGIMLHGAPSADREEIRAALLPALRKAGVTEDQLPLLMEQQLVRMIELRAMHERFAEEFGVGDGWYHLGFYYREIEQRDKGGTLIVSPAFLKTCVPSLPVRRFWYPKDAADRMALASLLGFENLWIISIDIDEPPTCR